MGHGNLEEELRLSQARYRFFVEQTAEGFYRLESAVPIPVAASAEDQVDLMYRHMFVAECNAFYARMYGAAPEEMVGKRLVELHQGPDEATNRAALVSFVRASHRVVDLETQEPSRSGATLHLLNNAVGIVEQGQLVSIWGTQRDITRQREVEAERQEFERKLYRTQRLESLGLLAGGIAHDFNNLLTVILGGASLAELELSPSSSTRIHLASVIRSAERGASLCRQLRDYAGGRSPKTAPVQLSRLVADLVYLLRVTIPRTVEVHCDLQPDLPTMIGDESLLQQVVMNLITNAAEATGEDHGVVTVSTESADRGAAVRLVVRDEGCGIDPEVLERVFEPFFSTKGSAGGRGLGLSAVQGIVERHGGTIEFDSTRGQGTTVSVLFPASNRSLRPKHVEEDSRPWVGPGLALIIDDEEDVRTVAQASLEHLGFDTLCAADGIAGLAAFVEQPHAIDLILVDASMPKMGGIELVNELRRIRPDVPIVLSSGYPREAMSVNPDGPEVAFLGKPYVLAELAEQIRAAGVEDRGPRRPQR